MVAVRWRERWRSVPNLSLAVPNPKVVLRALVPNQKSTILKLGPQPAQPQAPLEPEGGLPPLRGRRAEGGRHELRATGDLVGGGPILGKFGRTGTVKDRLLYKVR